MANPLQIANKSRLIEEKSKLLLDDLMKQYQQGTIKTPTELQYRLFIALEDLYTQIGKPTMQERLAWGPPSSEDYNTTMVEVYNDIKTLFSESDTMGKALIESFEQVELDRQILNWQMNDIKDRLKDINLKMAQSKGQVVFRDSFLDTKNFDKDMVKDEAVAIHTAEGVMSLGKLSADEYRQGATVRILEGNGFSGNTHQVRGLNGTYKFFGEDNTHLDLLTMVDGNADSWYEYEIFALSEQVKSDTLGYGFEYKEGMKWVKEDSGALRLYLEIELPLTRTLNWFSLSPFLPSDKGATPAIVRSVIIHDGKGAANEVSSGYDVLSEDKVFIFARQKCKKITIKLEQHTAYETTVGHFFFKELEQSTVNYMAKDKEQEGRRIDGAKPSIETLLYQYNPAKRELKNPERTEGAAIVDTDEIKETLFSVPNVKGQVQAGLEAITAKRYMIGIRDLGIYSYRFTGSSEYVSVSYESEDAIRSIMLDATTFIPPEFGEGDWIRYFISIDEGRNWKEISPRGTAKEGSKIQYIINGNVPIEGRFDNIGYLDTLQEVHNVRLKVQMSRPAELTDADYYTPLLMDYKITCGTVKGEN
jgi:hypothetical protein